MHILCNKFHGWFVDKNDNDNDGNHFILVTIKNNRTVEVPSENALETWSQVAQQLQFQPD